jgi:hypothetical protein
MAHRVYIKRTETGLAPLGGSLAPGELSVEMNDPMRLWVGVPGHLDPAGRKLLFDKGQLGNYVLRAGDTMLGPLTISSPINPQLTLNAAPGTFRSLSFTSSGQWRWHFTVTGDPETGADAGSNFTISRMHDDGSPIDAPLSISRATGRVNFVHGLTTNNNVVSLAYDLSRHIDLYGGQYGFSVTGSTLNIVTGIVTTLNVGALEVARFQTGGLTMSAGQDITLNREPTLPMHAVNKGYADGIMAGGPFLPLTGGTVTGAIAVGPNHNVPSISYALLVSNGYQNIQFMPRTAGGGYTSMTQDNDALILMSAGAIDTGALVLAPWASTPLGIRIATLDSSVSLRGGIISLGGTQNLVNADPTAPLGIVPKQYVDAADEILLRYIAILAEDMYFVGGMNVPLDQGNWTVVSQVPDLSPLPPPQAAYKGYYVIVTQGGSPPPGNIPPGVYDLADWIVCDGSEWVHLPIGGAKVIAQDVDVVPVIGPLGPNVQTSLQWLYDNKLDATMADGLYLRLSGGTVTGPLGANLGLTLGTSTQPAVSLWINSATASGASVTYLSAGRTRFSVGLDAFLEEGGDSGGNLTWYTYHDDGSFLGAPMSIRRSDGLTSVYNGLGVTGGITFGNVTSTAPWDLWKHISLWGGTFGFSVTSGRLNYVVDGLSRHHFVVGQTDAMWLDLVSMRLAGYGVTYSGLGGGNVFGFTWTGSQAKLWVDGLDQGPIALSSQVPVAATVPPPIDGGAWVGSNPWIYSLSDHIHPTQLRHELVLADADRTLTIGEMAKFGLYLYGGPVGPVTLTVPVATTPGTMWQAMNITPQPVRLQGSNGNGVTVQPGGNQQVWTDGAGVYPLNITTITPATGVGDDSVTNTRYVDAADAFLQMEIAVLAEDLFFVGGINVPLDQGNYTVISGVPDLTPLPLPQAAYKGFYLIVTQAGSPPVGNIPPGVYSLADWIVCDGAQWVHLPIGGAKVIAQDVDVVPVIGPLGPNVQTSLQWLYDNKVDLSIGDGRWVNYTGDEMTGMLRISYTPNDTTSQLWLRPANGNDGQSIIRFGGTFATPIADIGARYITSIRSGMTNGWTTEYLDIWINIGQNDANSDLAQQRVVRFTKDLVAIDRALTVTGDATVIGKGKFPNGAIFGENLIGANAQDLSKHIALWGYTYGISVTGNTLNLVSGGSNVDLYVGSTNRVAWFTAGALTMTTPILLPGPPTDPLHAVTKQYVDGISAGGGGYLPLTGGAVTGLVTINPTTTNPAWALILGGTTTDWAGHRFGVHGDSQFVGDVHVKNGLFVEQEITANYTMGIAGPIQVFGDPRDGSLTEGHAIIRLTPSPGKYRSLEGHTSSSIRWAIVLGGPQPETGANAGSDYSLQRYDDNGVWIDNPLFINRATGVITFGSMPYFNGAPIGGGAFVPLTGGSMSGVLQTPGLHAFALDSMWGSNGYIRWGAWNDYCYHLCTGTDGYAYLYHVSGAVYSHLLTMQPGGFYSTAPMASSGAITSNSGRLLSIGPSNPSVAVYNSSAGLVSGMWEDVGGALWFGDCDGAGVPAHGRFGIDRSSNLTVNAGVYAQYLQSGGTAYVAGRFTTNEIMNYSGVFRVANNEAYYLARNGTNGNWDFVEGGAVTFTVAPGGHCYATGILQAASNVYAIGGQMMMAAAGAGRIMQFAPSWYWDWNISNGNLHWVTPSGPSLVLAADRNIIMEQGLFVNGSAIVCQTNCIGVKYQSGAYATSSYILFGWSNVVGSLATISIDNGGAVYAMANASDERLKMDIEPSTLDGLETVNRIPLVAFDWLDVDEPWALKQARTRGRKSPITGRARVGVIAQQVREVFPEGVHAGDDFDDHLGRVWALDQNAMIALLVKSVQQLSEQNTALMARVEQLEQRTTH